MCMLMEETQTDSADIQTRVLQSTLAEVASLRNTTTSDSRGAGPVAETVETCCVICLDSISEVCEAQPCGHRDFDYLCLLSWLQQQPRCPLCKSNVREVWYDFPGGSTSNATDAPDGCKVYVVPPAKQPVGQGQQQQVPLWSQRSGSGIVHPLDRENALRRRRRRFEERPPPRPATEDEALAQRRRVYQQQLYSLHVGTSPRTGYRDLTPQSFEADAELVSRARRWLRRELQVFEFLCPSTTTTATPPQPPPSTGGGSSSSSAGDARLARRRASNAEFLLEYIVAILKTVDVQGSRGQAEEMLKDFLGRDHARLLLHELRSYLRSPYTSLEAWDRKVQYPGPNSNSNKRRRPSMGTEDEGGSDDQRHGSAMAARYQKQFRNSGNGYSERMDSPASTRGLVDSYRPSYARYRDRRRRTERQYTPD